MILIGIEFREEGFWKIWVQNPQEVKSSKDFKEEPRGGSPPGLPYHSRKELDSL